MISLTESRSAVEIDNPTRRPLLLSPALVAALTELAIAEDLPLATLIALLLNEALGYRLRQRGRS